MFDFLQNLSHQHPPKHKKEQIHQSPIDETKQAQKIQNPKEQQNNKKTVAHTHKPNKPPKLSLSAQLQRGNLAALDAQTLTILQRMSQQSSKWLNDLTYSMITDLKANVERKVYLRQMSHNNEEYLQQILIQSSSNNRFIRHGIAEMVDTVAGAIMDDIFTDKYQITKKLALNKDDLFLLEQSLSKLKSRDGNIRDKVGQLKMQMLQESQKINERSEDIVNKKSFSIEDQKTKQVSAFLKNIQFQRSIERQKYLNTLDEDRRKKKQKSQRMEAARQKAKSQRHQRLVEEYNFKRKYKDSENQKAQKRAEEFQNWLKNFEKKKPLYKQLQDKYFQQFIMKENDQKMRKLAMKKNDYAPIDFDEIEDHDERYDDIKRENQRKRKIGKNMRIKAEEERKKQFSQLHKGQFRYNVLEEMIKQKQANLTDPKNQLKIKKAKQLAYSENVKMLHKPKVSETKRRQSESFIEPTRKKQRYGGKRMRMNDDGDYTNYSVGNIKSSYETQKSLDPRVQGERNRRYLKNFVREKIQLGLIKDKSQQRMQLKTVEPRPNYLQELRKGRDEERVKKVQTINAQIDKLKEKSDIRILKTKAEQYDERIRRKEKKIQHEHHTNEEKAKLEDDYLFSIKAKMELIKNFN